MDPDDREIYIDQPALVEVAKTIPPEDFADRQFDCTSSTKTTAVLILLSTPRCGSTFVADQIRSAGWCLPHEYFQPFQYLPLLADRWGCIFDGRLDKAEYVRQLCSMRTYPNGWLGINLHGNHLATFAGFSRYLPGIAEQYVRVSRRDRIAQAVSYEIASQTGKWSSHFQAGADAAYNFEAISKRLQTIEEREAMIDAFLEGRDASVATICYEDLIASPETVLRSILPDSISPQDLPSSALQPQANQVNRDWSERFASEFKD